MRTCSFTSTKVLIVICRVDPNSALIQGLSNDASFSYTASVNKAEAKKKILGWREYDRPELLTENTNRTAAARIEDRNGAGDAQYASMDSGLYIMSGDFDSPAP